MAFLRLWEVNNPNLQNIIFQLLYQFLLLIDLCCKFCYLAFCCLQQRRFLRKLDLKLVRLAMTKGNW